MQIQAARNTVGVLVCVFAVMLLYHGIGDGRVEPLNSLWTAVGAAVGFAVIEYLQRRYRRSRLN